MRRGDFGSQHRSHRLMRDAKLTRDLPEREPFPRQNYYPSARLLIDRHAAFNRCRTSRSPNHRALWRIGNHHPGVVVTQPREQPPSLPPVSNETRHGAGAFACPSLCVVVSDSVSLSRESGEGTRHSGAPGDRYLTFSGRGAGCRGPRCILPRSWPVALPEPTPRRDRRVNWSIVG